MCGWVRTERCRTPCGPEARATAHWWQPRSSVLWRCASSPRCARAAPWRCGVASASISSAVRLRVRSNAGGEFPDRTRSGRVEPLRPVETQRGVVLTIDEQLDARCLVFEQPGYAPAQQRAPETDPARLGRHSHDVDISVVGMDRAPTEPHPPLARVHQHQPRSIEVGSAGQGPALYDRRSRTHRVFGERRVVRIAPVLKGAIAAVERAGVEVGGPLERGRDTSRALEGPEESIRLEAECACKTLGDGSGVPVPDSDLLAVAEGWLELPKRVSGESASPSAAPIGFSHSYPEQRPGLALRIELQEHRETDQPLFAGSDPGSQHRAEGMARRILQLAI